MRKFEQYKPVRFETEGCETERCNYMGKLDKTKRLSPFGRDARMSVIVPKRGRKESLAEVDENNNTIRGFVNRLRNEDALHTRSPLVERPNFQKVIKYDKNEDRGS